MKLGIILIYIFIFYITYYILYYTYNCRPTCNGLSCDISDGCGGTCKCDNQGLCSGNKCCYPKCDGVSCDISDGCGGTCKCTKIQNGSCNQGKCCYSKNIDYISCGDDGCGGTLPCREGITCKNGRCLTEGVGNWTYFYNNTIPNIKSTQLNSKEECALWDPVNRNPIYLDFKCDKDSDCPSENSCVNGYCRHLVYPYWIYENGKCTKLPLGTATCGLEKEGVYAFNIIKNFGPDKETCKNK